MDDSCAVLPDLQMIHDGCNGAAVWPSASSGPLFQSLRRNDRGEGTREDTGLQSANLRDRRLMSYNLPYKHVLDGFAFVRETIRCAPPHPSRRRVELLPQEVGRMRK